jgi:hypothetical protein
LKNFQQFFDLSKFSRVCFEPTTPDEKHNKEKNEYKIESKKKNKSKQNETDTEPKQNQNKQKKKYFSVEEEQYKVCYAFPIKKQTESKKQVS